MHKPKVHLDRFVDPYDHTNDMENNNGVTQLVKLKLGTHQIRGFIRIIIS